MENNPGDAGVIAAAFAESGYACKLIFADSHSEALQRLLVEDFDPLLTYFGMDFEGAQHFLRSVRMTAPLMPIVVLSSIADPNPAYSAGANAFVRKGTDLQEFLDKIRSLMHFWTEVAELPQRPPLT